MIVSWKWLEQYVDLKMSHDDLVDRLTMSGLNHEGTENNFDDQAIDLEVTSNRPDCLGHIGVAREIAVLYDLKHTIPDPQPKTSGGSVADVCKVEIECPELCRRYTARVLKGVKIGPSPDWIADKLKAVGIAVINNVVDATNYVMLECGQPLHAFDFAKVKDGKIIVRQPKADEAIEAIDHKTYKLAPGMCVIADAESPVAIGGVMGGAESEISDTTTDVLVEAAFFEPLSIRNTARSLNLFSPSSFRFERTIDSHQIDWASRRCCELIMESGGGELLEGVVDVGETPGSREPVTMRLTRLDKVLGIEVPKDVSAKVLKELGCEINESTPEKVTITPPTWRADMSREVDLIEEVGRIYGFDKVPDDANVPMAASQRPTADRVIDRVRSVLNANGFDEAMCASLVPEKWSEAFSPWSNKSPLLSSQPMLGVLEKASQGLGAVELVRRSLVPSLLEARRINEYRSNDEIELFETSKVYLSNGDDAIPDQPLLVSLVSGKDFYTVKGVVEALVRTLDRNTRIALKPFDHPLLDVTQSGEISVGDKRLGFIGVVSADGMKQFGLKTAACIVELDCSVLEELAILIPQHTNQSLFPSISRDFNFILANAIHWSDLENTVRGAGGELLEAVNYRETFRNEEKDGAGKKRVLMSVTLRSPSETLTSEQAEAVTKKILADCKSNHSAELLG